MSPYRMAMAAAILVMSLGDVQVLYALSLDEAKSRGLVGEKLNGYVGAVNPVDPEAQALAKDINEKRRQAYQDIARRNGTAITVVETLAGEKAIKNTQHGHYVEGPAGWAKK